MKQSIQKFLLTFVACCGCGTCLLTSNLVAVVPLSQDHVDIGINYESGSWDLHIHDEETDTEYEPDEAKFNVFTNTLGPVSNSPATALGVADGTNAWVLPETDPGEGSGILFLGISAEELALGVFDSDLVLVEFSLNSAPLGGDFAVYRGPELSFETVFSSAQSISNSISLTASAVEGEPHEHYSFGFTEAGTYLVDITASGDIGGSPTSATETYEFNVVNAIPEPSSATLLGVGALAWWMRKRSRK